jgi:Spy/CpxP family protein refolding chaperone
MYDSLNSQKWRQKMKMNNFVKAVTVLAIAGIVGFAATSFAGWGRGGGGNCWGQGSGGGQRGYAPSGDPGNMSDEQITRLDKQRQAFFEETRNLRENLYQKELELRSELAKEDPDGQKAAGLQAEISGLTAQLDQKRIDRRLKMQKDNPEFFAGRGYGKGGRGKGRGFYGQGQGFRGQRGCCGY